MKRFFRCFSLSFVIVLCIALLVLGIFKSYENMQKLSFGEYVKAVELTSDSIRILDFTFKL